MIAKLQLWGRSIHLDAHLVEDVERHEEIAIALYDELLRNNLTVIVLHGDVIVAVRPNGLSRRLFLDLSISAYHGSRDGTHGSMGSREG